MLSGLHPFNSVCACARVCIIYVTDSRDEIRAFDRTSPVFGGKKKPFKGVEPEPTKVFIIVLRICAQFFTRFAELLEALKRAKR